MPQIRFQTFSCCCPCLCCCRQRPCTCSCLCYSSCSCCCKPGHQQIHAAVMDCTSHNMQVNSLETSIIQARRSIGNATLAFGGDAAVKLSHALNKVYLKRFHRPPIGPLGLYLTLKHHRSALTALSVCTAAVYMQHATCISLQKTTGQL